MTSNVAAGILLQTKAADSQNSTNEVVLKELTKHFKPEFINRIDEVVCFHRLEKSHLRKILELQIIEMNQLLQEKSIGVSFTKTAKTRLVDIGFNPSFGARPLKRAMQKHVYDPFAVEILKGNIKNGDNVLCDINKTDDKIYFKKILVEK